MQYPQGYERYLVDSVGECAVRMVDLLRDREAGRAFGAAAKERVRQAFLLPRMLRDELRLMKELLGGTHSRASGGVG